MNEYKHLNLEERERYYALKEQGLSLREIGRRLGRSHSTFVREKRRMSLLLNLILNLKIYMEKSFNPTSE